MPEKKTKITNKKSAKTINRKITVKSTTKRKPGRPPKNVIWEKKWKWTVGRPRKNIIKPKSVITTKPTTKKKPKKTTKKPIKKSTNQKKQITNKLQDQTNFIHHKIKKLKKQNNFALILLIFSFALFIFSIYKAFFAVNNIREIHNSINNITKNDTNKSDKIKIQSYNEIMWNDNKTKTWTTTQNNLWEQIKTTEIAYNPFPDTKIIESNTLPIHKFDKSFNKDEQNEEIKILQQLLLKEWLYTWEINGINDQETRSAIYSFQLKYNIISQKDAYNLRGYFGPSTRYKANLLMPK